MCVYDWQLVTLAMFTQLLIITYDELDGRRRSKADRHGDHHTAPAPDAERKGHQP